MKEELCFFISPTWKIWHLYILAITKIPLVYSKIHFELSYPNVFLFYEFQVLLYSTFLYF